MAKLSKMELDALSYDIRKSIIDSKKEQVENDKIQKLNDFYQTELGIAIKFVNDHEDMSSKTGISNYVIHNLAGIPTTIYPSAEEIKRKLIIKQIDCSDSEELIKSVTEAFLNQ